MSTLKFPNVQKLKSQVSALSQSIYGLPHKTALSPPPNLQSESDVSIMQKYCDTIESNRCSSYSNMNSFIHELGSVNSKTKSQTQDNAKKRCLCDYIRHKEHENYSRPPQIKYRSPGSPLFFASLHPGQQDKSNAESNAFVSSKPPSCKNDTKSPKPIIEHKHIPKTKRSQSCS